MESRARPCPRCSTTSWPGAGRGQDFDLVRLIESGDEVVVTYESETSDGGRGRNTEVFTFDDEDKITRTEVYFGWNLDQPPFRLR